MTTTTSKLGADMLTDEQIAAFEGLPIEQAKFYFDRRNADGRTHREMVDALRARQAAAIDKQDKQPNRDTKQLADWLLIDPQTGEPLHFAGPLERDFLRMSRVKMESKSGDVWTLTAGLKEGYLTSAERMANLEKVAAEERQAAREPSIEQLTEMAYLLELVPRGEVVCVQFLDVLRKQYRAAMEASGV
jgi:hypothetical protein